jgi:predicted ribosome quality control (RQC) complex YloA/Tae2 family protein
VDYFIGKSSKENFDLIDAALMHHLWFHVDGHSSGHVIAAVPEKMDRKSLRYVIKQGAVLCKQHSKFASMKNVNIVYTLIQNVEKSEREGSVRVTCEKTITI